MAIEQLPLGADLGSLVLFRAEDLRVSAGKRRIYATIRRAGAVEFGPDGVGRGCVGNIHAAIGQWLDRQAEIEVRNAEFRSLGAKYVRSSTRAPAVRIDLVIVVANAAVEDN